MITYLMLWCTALHRCFTNLVAKLKTKMKATLVLHSRSSQGNPHCKVAEITYSIG